MTIRIHKVILCVSYLTLKPLDVGLVINKYEFRSNKL